MTDIKITTEAEKYLSELLDNQEEETIGIKIFVSEAGTPTAETCIAYAKKEDNLSAYIEKKNLIFPLYLEEKSLNASFPEATINICNEINKLII